MAKVIEKDFNISIKRSWDFNSIQISEGFKMQMDEDDIKDRGHYVRECEHLKHLVNQKLNAEILNLKKQIKDETRRTKK